MQEVLVSKIFNYTSTPTKNVEGQFWFNPSTNVLSRYNGTTWKPITVSSDDVAVLTDGNKVSLTSYLNTQIAALAEGIDTKQDQLSYYNESNGNVTINTAGDIMLLSLNDSSSNLEYTKVTVDGRNISVDANNQNVTGETNILTIGVGDKGMTGVEVTSLSGALITTSINSSDTQLPTSKAVSDALATKQNNLQYYSEDTTKTVSKLNSNRLEVTCYDESGNTVNPFISNNNIGIAVGGETNYGDKAVFTNIGTGYINLETPAGDSSLAADSLKIEGSNTGKFSVILHPSTTEFTTNKIALTNSELYSHGLLNLDNEKVNISGATVSSIPPSAFTSTEAQTLICADAFAIKPTTNTLFGFNNSTYNILTNRSAGLFYLKNTDAKSTGIAINPDRILLSDYNSYNDATDEASYFEATTIGKGVINLQQRTNGSSQFIDTGSIKPDTIKLTNGKCYGEYDYTSDIVITGSRTSGFATNFHGIAYSGTQYDSNITTQWFIGRTVDGDNIVGGYPTFSKPYIKGFANAEFSETVQATTVQAGKEASADSGVATLTQSGLNFNTPDGVADYTYKDISLLAANFEVKAQNGNTPAYIQIPDGNTTAGFKIWKGTETEFKALTSVNSDTVYLRVQDNNRIKATVGADTSSLDNITDSYTLSSAVFTSFITDTKYNNAQGSILITPNLTNSGALIFGEGITDTSKGFPLYPDNIVSIPFKNITNFQVAGNLNDSFNYIISFDI